MLQSFRIYLLPGFMFQSFLIGGGYGTGREIVAFFLVHETLGGLLGMATAAIAWCFLLAIAFEWARVYRAYDYRSFFRKLVGPFWRVFELTYLLLALLILSVVGSAAGEMFADMTGLPAIYGTIGLLFCVGVIVYHGSKLIERVFSVWSILLYVVYAVLLIWVITKYGDIVTASFEEGGATGEWAFDGLRYASYNFVVIAQTLFVLRHLKTRRQALLSGVCASFIGMIPAVLLLFAMASQYPEVLQEAVPVTLILNSLQSPAFVVIFHIVLLGTFIETGVGVIHSFNERIAAAYEDRGRRLPAQMRFLIGVSAFAVAVFLANQFGIITLVAQGYSAMSYVFLLVLIIPIATIGLYRVITVKDGAGQCHT